MSGISPSKFPKLEPNAGVSNVAPYLVLPGMSSLGAVSGVAATAQQVSMTSQPIMMSSQQLIAARGGLLSPGGGGGVVLQQGAMLLTTAGPPALSPVYPQPAPVNVARAGQARPLPAVPAPKAPDTGDVAPASNVVFSCPLDQIGNYFIPDPTAKLAPRVVEDADPTTTSSPPESKTSVTSGHEMYPPASGGASALPAVRPADDTSDTAAASNTHQDGFAVTPAPVGAAGGEPSVAPPPAEQTPVAVQSDPPAAEVEPEAAAEVPMIQRDVYEHVPTPVPDPSIAERLLEFEYELCETLNWVSFTDPVTHVYNPLEYARETHECFVRKYCCSEKKVLFLGMNPGPFGMAQNGVPFGVKDAVINWLRITGKIGKPAKEHPKRPILGFDCPRTEISGTRFWDLFKLVCGDPEVFFRHCYVHNYCPMAFMSKTGRNVTPNNLHITNREPLLHACDVALAEVVRLLKIDIIIAIGKFAHDRTKLALKTSGLDSVRVECILHPSPINPMANHGWNGSTIIKLKQLGVWKYLLPSE